MTLLTVKALFPEIFCSPGKKKKKGLYRGERGRESEKPGRANLSKWEGER